MRNGMRRRAKNRKRPVIGDRVLILPGHPHRHQMGVYARDEWISTLSRMGRVVRLDDGGSCFVFNDDDWMKVDG
jgi:hypothetical protein